MIGKLVAKNKITTDWFTKNNKEIIVDIGIITTERNVNFTIRWFSGVKESVFQLNQPRFRSSGREIIRIVK